MDDKQQPTDGLQSLTVYITCTYAYKLAKEEPMYVYLINWQVFVHADHEYSTYAINHMCQAPVLRLQHATSLNIPDSAHQLIIKPFMN